MCLLIVLCVALLILTATSGSSQRSSHPQAPVFVVEPDDVYYVVKGRPVTLRCRAAPAIQISVKCGGQWISPTQQVNEDIVDPSTGVSYLQTSVDISKEQVDEQFGEEDYQCECHAWNNVPDLQPLLTRSRKATLHVACEYRNCVYVCIYIYIYLYLFTINGRKKFLP